MAAKISHEWVVPKHTMIKLFEEINATSLSFGVHSEDNDKHAQRDREQQKAVHSAFYGSTKPISNASLLRQTEEGYVTTVNRTGGRLLVIKVPPRPLLKPIMESNVRGKDFSQAIGNCIERVSTKPIEQRFGRIGKRLDVKEYIRRMGWRNARTTAMVKHLEKQLGTTEMSDDQILELVYSSSSAGVSRRQVLEDSGDLLRSIKAKVTKNGV